MQDNDNILHKIKHLVDKANSTDSIQEAEIFMLKAQELLQKYNLDISHVTSYSEKGEAIAEETFHYQENWEMKLAGAIAKNNLCSYFLETRCKNITIVGKPSNTNAVLYMFSFFRNAILQLSIVSYDNFNKEYFIDMKIKPKAGFKNDFINNYLMGCVQGVKDKMLKAQSKLESGNSEFKGLIVVNTGLIEDYLRKNYPYMGSVSISSGNQNSGAFNLGRKDGSGILVNPAIAAGRKMIG